MKLRLLNAQQIKLNERLPWNVRNQTGELLLSKGTWITTQPQLDALLDRGVYVDQDDFEEVQRAVQVAQRMDPFTIWSGLRKHVAKLLRDPQLTPNFAEEVVKTAGMLQKAIKRDVEAATFEMVSGDSNGYAVNHALQTAFVAALVSERFAWSEADRTNVICAALTMNISMMDLQNTLSNQSAPLTASQKTEVQLHPIKGRALLEQCGVTDVDWLTAVEKHHSPSEAQGSPQDSSDAGRLAALVHYADVYLAKISPRSSRPAIAVNVAARDLFVTFGGADNPYTGAIIKEMGIFPPGSFVKLHNGDTAVVVRRGEAASAPKVHSLVSADGWVFPDPVMRDTSRPEHKVVATVPKGNVMLSLNPKKLFGYTD